MRKFLPILLFISLNISAQYSYYNFEYSKDFYIALQKKTDYDKISNFIISKIDNKLFTEKLLFIPFYLPECGSCDEARESSQSYVINKISFSNFWSEKTFNKFLKKFPEKAIIITSDYTGTGNDPIDKDIANEFNYLNKLNKTIGIKNRNGTYPEEIYVFNNLKKEKIEIDEDIISNSNFLLIDLKLQHNNVNGREKNLKTNNNILIISVRYIIKGNSEKMQYFIYNYDSKEIIFLTDEERIKRKFN